ncbi:hypothetical protein GCM10023329_07450 [Streptomyces sanyensis]|uniref:Lipoprotein n=1 Tax=Streptomyces sanyensis TaxID=568869 RepID=A0ABP8ZRM4_9ACTN
MTIASGFSAMGFLSGCAVRGARKCQAVEEPGNGSRSAVPAPGALGVRRGGGGAAGAAFRGGRVPVPRRAVLSSLTSPAVPQSPAPLAIAGSDPTMDSVQVKKLA